MNTPQDKIRDELCAIGRELDQLVDMNKASAGEHALKALDGNKEAHLSAKYA